MGEMGDMTRPPPVLETDITIMTPAWRDTFADVEARARVAAEAAFVAVLAAADAPIDVHHFSGRAVEISIALADDSYVHELNRKWRGQDKPTNVLSFANLDDHTGALSIDAEIALGDVILALETCKREAQTQEKPFSDHLTHLVVHGVLHLLGYDHEVDGDAEQMESLEKEILQGLNVPNPYAQMSGEEN